MSDNALDGRIGAAIEYPVAPEVAALAHALAQAPGVQAVLFYGSNLRTGSLDGVLDFYVLTGARPARGPWPRITWIERTVDGLPLQAKTATMALATFDRAARGQLLDTTIWARFVQPAALVWVRDALVRTLVVDALAAAAITAARAAAALGPARGSETDYWQALFRATYTAELRVERPGRERAILEAAPAHFAGLLPLAWRAGTIAFVQESDALRPMLSPAERARTLRWWRLRRLAGKPLNLRRLARAATTFDGAARYAAWKLERHSGERIRLPRIAERHPLLAAPALARGLWRARRRRRERNHG